METKRFKGKAIYQPSGKAAEYSPWACNFFTGCSNNCDYCYCKLGHLGRIWSKEPQLKKCFKDKEHAVKVFTRELFKNLPALRATGIFFSFTTDPMLASNSSLTYTAAIIANDHRVPVQILTKRADFVDDLGVEWLDSEYTAFGFTLTGSDELEPGASSNQERIEAMRKLHDRGFKTFASIEPVINPLEAIDMIEETLDFCDLYKVGLISGKPKDFYNLDSVQSLFNYLGRMDGIHKIYPKDSLLKYLGIERDQLNGNFVNSDYNIFNPNDDRLT